MSAPRLLRGGKARQPYAATSPRRLAGRRGLRQARGSKGREAQRIKPGLALLLLAVEVERIAAAGLDVARDPGVERRDLKAVTPAPTPITNGRQGSFDEPARAPPPMPNPAPPLTRDLRVDCRHMRTPDATELARARRKRSYP